MGLGCVGDEGGCDAHFTRKRSRSNLGTTKEYHYYYYYYYYYC